MHLKMRLVIISAPTLGVEGFHLYTYHMDGANPQTVDHIKIQGLEDEEFRELRGLGTVLGASSATAAEPN